MCCVHTVRLQDAMCHRKRNVRIFPPPCAVCTHSVFKTQCANIPCVTCTGNICTFRFENGMCAHSTWHRQGNVHILPVLCAVCTHSVFKTQCAHTPCAMCCMHTFRLHHGMCTYSLSHVLYAHIPFSPRDVHIFPVSCAQDIRAQHTFSLEDAMCAHSCEYVPSTHAQLCTRVCCAHIPECVHSVQIGRGWPLIIFARFTGTGGCVHIAVNMCPAHVRSCVHI